MPFHPILTALPATWLLTRQLSRISISFLYFIVASEKKLADMGISMWDMLASHSSWKINVLCMMAWARERNCCSQSIKWNYEIIRWTVKLINMMTYFIRPKIFLLDVITPIFLMWNFPINIILKPATFSYFSPASFLS